MSTGLNKIEAYWGSASTAMSVWENNRQVQHWFDVKTMQDAVTLLGDAGFLVISDWTNIEDSSFGGMWAALERVEEWDARNGVVSRQAPDSEAEFTPCQYCGDMLRTSFDYGWKTHLDFCSKNPANL